MMYLCQNLIDCQKRSKRELIPAKLLTGLCLLALELSRHRTTSHAADITIEEQNWIYKVIWHLLEVYSLQCRRKSVHKKVLLRERKRHTARRIASARYADLSPDGGGGYPIQTWDGVPPPRLDLGWGTPLCKPGTGPPPPFRPGMRYPPLAGRGTNPPPPPRCGLTHKVKLLASPILWMRPVNIINVCMYDMHKSFQVEIHIGEYLRKKEEAVQAVALYLDALMEVGVSWYNGEYPLVLMDNLVFQWIKARQRFACIEVFHKLYRIEVSIKINCTSNDFYLCKILFRMMN